MFNFSYKYCDHVAYLHQLAAFIGVALKENVLYLPPEFGSGYIKVIELPNGLQVLVNECILNQGVCIHREASDGTEYTLRFDEVRNMNALTLKMGEWILEEDNQVYSGAFLTSSFPVLEYTTTAGTESRCVNIYFTEEWFNTHLGLSRTDGLLTKYLSLNTATFNFEVLNIEYRQLMEEIFSLKEDHPIYKNVLQNRVMLLIENFLRNLYNRLTVPGKEITYEENEIKRMMQVESVLVRNLSVSPPAIPHLARLSMMSETKLKTLFKKVYHYAPYEYYQKNRMLKAKYLLNTKHYTIKEVGVQLGFKNLSNFTVAFKKEFGMLPSDV